MLKIEGKFERFVAISSVGALTSSSATTATTVGGGSAVSAAHSAVSHGTATHAVSATTLRTTKFSYRGLEDFNVPKFQIIQVGNLKNLNLNVNPQRD